MLISTDPWIGSDSLTRAAMIAHEYTLHEWYPVANTTARAQLVTDLGTAGVSISASNPVRVYRADATGGLEHEVSEDGSSWTAISVPTALTSLTFEANWTTDTIEPKVRYNGALVELTTGRIKRTGSNLSVTAGTLYQWATLPAAGYHPSANIVVPATLHLSSDTPTMGEVVITSAGAVSFRPAANGTMDTATSPGQGFGSICWPRV